MTHVNDITGKTYGRVVVLRRNITDRHRHATWVCQCSCGIVFVASGINLRTGNTKSCGCLRSEVAKVLSWKHGHTANSKGKVSMSKTYRSYRRMRDKCYNQKTEGYNKFGKRGITVCDRWKDDFRTFLADMGEMPPNTRLVLKEGAHIFSPDTCLWKVKLSRVKEQKTVR